MRKTLAIMGCIAVLLSSAPKTWAAAFSFGTAGLFNNNTTTMLAVTPINETHVFIAYSDNGVGKAIVATMDGTDISYGSAATRRT